MRETTRGANFISLADASRELGVSRTTMYYYLEQLNIEQQKFPLDKRKYISLADFDRIKEAKQRAIEGSH